MKRLYCALFIASLLLLSAGPALAELKVTFVNLTDFEIQNIKMSGDGMSMQSDIRVVPGNECTFTDGNSSELTGVSIDVGLMLFNFEDMAALAGRSEIKLELSFDADNRPHLTMSEQAASDGSFDLEAGPIWDNAHATQRCPEVLAEWLAERPGTAAEWTGQWVTTIPGEMSVCGIKITSGDIAAAPKPVPELINVVGKVTVLADARQAAKVDLAALLQAKTMAEARALGGQDSPISEKELLIPVSFAGKTWAALVGEDSSSYTFPSDYDEQKVTIGSIKMRTYTSGNALANTLTQIKAMGYRPWFMQTTEGSDMDTTAMVQFATEQPDEQAAWSQATKQCESLAEAKAPKAVELLIIPQAGYEQAVRGSDAAIPGFRLRVSNAEVMTMVYMTDASVLVQMTR